MAEMVVKRMTSRIFAPCSLDLSLVIVSVLVISNTICALEMRCLIVLPESFESNCKQRNLALLMYESGENFF
jgi:hypothetical protein